MAEIGNVTVKVDAVITDEQYREAMGAVKAANERIDLLEHENAKLQDENARLRSCLSDDAENARMIMGENAKLRELVAELWHELHAEQGSAQRRMEIADRMRELGVVE